VVVRNSSVEVADNWGLVCRVRHYKVLRLVLGSNVRLFLSDKWAELDGYRDCDQVTLYDMAGKAYKGVKKVWHLTDTGKRQRIIEVAASWESLYVCNDS
jgi:hypothetical protein